MCTRAAVFAVVFATAALAVGLGAPAAHASPLCVDGDDDTDDAPQAAPERVILPCALADGAAGCADAAVYVLTTGGVLLCEIDIPALTQQGEAPIVEDTPGVPASISVAASAYAVPVDLPALPPLLVRDAPRAPAQHPGHRRDVVLTEAPPPS